MKAKNQIFSGSLMCEAMRQVKLPGIIGALLLSGAAFFSTIIRLFEAREFGTTLVSYDFMNVDSYIMFVMYVFAPLMVMMLFGFMNRRRASDFYHSLSYSRICIYMSFMAAVILWCAIIIVSCSLVPVVITAFSHSLQLDFKSAVFIVVSAMAGCILTASVTALAMTLTGTYLTNVITALLILFVPRGIMLVCNMLFSTAMPFVVLTENTFLGNESNIPFAFIASVFGYYEIGSMEMLNSIKPALYSIILGLIYASVGAVCFVKRKSENATQASVNRGLQSILRMIPAIVISMVAVSVLFGSHTSGESISESKLFVTAMAYVGATAAYFLYEIITTRRVRKIYRTIPGLLIVFAVSFVMYFSLRFSYDYNLAQTPEADELEYVVVHGPDNNVFWQDTQDVKLYSEAARRVASDCLKDTINRWVYNRNGAKGFYNQFYTGNMVVEYHYADGKSIARKVIVNDTRYAQLQRALTSESGFASNFGKSVFASDNASDNIRYFIGALDADNDMTRQVYETFIEEIKENGISKLFEIIDNRKSDDSLFQITFEANRGSMYSTAYIGIDMPRTLTAYMNALNKQQKYGSNGCKRFTDAFELVKESAENEQNTEGSYFRCSIDFNLYTILPDGTLERSDAYGYAYDDGEYVTLPSDESASYISELGKMLNVRHITLSDIKPGNMLLYVQCYEERTAISVGYDSAADYSVDLSYASNATEYYSDFGWYVVDERVMYLMKKISSDTVISIEK